VDALSFSVERGTVYSIIGPNGAGKTTVFNCINGIYKPTEGSIWFDGAQITGMRPDQIARRGIARTFQNIELFGHATTMENLMLGRHLRMRAGVWRGATMFHRRAKAALEEVEHRERAERIIDLLDLQCARDTPVAKLPYGARKLVELGRALALEPVLLLLDEPSAGMNSEERQDLMFWIRDIQAEFGVTILLIEHHMQMVMDISDRVLAIDFGRAIVEGPPHEVAEHPGVVEAYLGVKEPFASATEGQ
jgi:branched-chain amino acid transport system ATP-binding protein